MSNSHRISRISLQIRSKLDFFSSSEFIRIAKNRFRYRRHTVSIQPSSCFTIRPCTNFFCIRQDVLFAEIWTFNYVFGVFLCVWRFFDAISMFYFFEQLHFVVSIRVVSHWWKVRRPTEPMEVTHSLVVRPNKNLPFVTHFQHFELFFHRRVAFFYCITCFQNLEVTQISILKVKLRRRMKPTQALAADSEIAVEHQIHVQKHFYSAKFRLKSNSNLPSPKISFGIRCHTVTAWPARWGDDVTMIPNSLKVF